MEDQGASQARDAPLDSTAPSPGEARADISQQVERTSAAAALSTALLPGVLAGTQITGLIFFLNPHLPFDLGPVVRGVLFYSLIFGTASTAILFPLLWRRRHAREVLPWSLVAVLATIGLGAWIHASYYAFYLPPGINRRLLKAAVLLSLAGLIGFYAVLLHLVRQRRYGPRGRLLFLILGAASIYMMMERREAFNPPLEPSPRASTFAGSSRPTLCVAGLEAATLDAILPLAEQGRLPFFSKVLQEGAHARLHSLRPTRRDPLWTTLAVGKYPFQHGIVGSRSFPASFLGSSERLFLLPVGVGFEHWGAWGESQPISSSDKRALALWEILPRLGIPTGLVGWPLTAPPPEGLRVGLAERYFRRGESAGNVRPQELGERARLFRTRTEEIDPNLASRFGPRPPAQVLRILADDLWREQLSFFLLEQEPKLEAFFTVLPGLGRMSETYFGGFAAVQFEGSQDPSARQAEQLLSAYYIHLDEFLNQLWQRCPEPRLLVVVSPHGIDEPAGWRKALGAMRREPETRGYRHAAPDGVLMLLGEGIRTGETLRQAELVDLAPTLLYGLGFPIAHDFDGAVLTNAFETGFLARQPLSFLPSYETFATPEPQSLR